MSQLPALGAKVRIKRYVVKGSKDLDEFRVERMCVRVKLPDVIEGIFAGKRTWTTGVMSRGYSGSGDVIDQTYFCGWDTTRQDAVWIVYTSPHKNPVYVFPEDCEVIE